jgi:hypothetical protein
MYVYALCASVNGSLVGHTKQSSSTQEAILESWNSWLQEVSFSDSTRLEGIIRVCIVGIQYQTSC